MPKFLPILETWLIFKTPLSIIAAVILFFLVRFIVRQHYKKKHYLSQNIHLIQFSPRNPRNNICDVQGDMIYPLREAIKQHPTANAFLLQIGPVITLNLVDPAHIKEFCKKELTHFERMDSQQTFELLMKNGISGLSGDAWKLHKKILTNCFNPDILDKNIAQSQSIIIEHFDSLSDNDLNEFVVKDQFKKVFSAIIAQNFFGENIDKQLVDGKSSYEYRTELIKTMYKLCYTPIVLLAGSGIIKRGILGSHKRFVADAARYNRFLQRIVKEKRDQLAEKSDFEGKSMVERFINAQKEFPEHATTTLNDASIAGEFTNLLFSGNEMISVVLATTLYYLAVYPKLTSDLRQEIESHIPGGKVTSVNQINNLELMHSVLKEVLRLFAPVGITVKRALKNTKILDIKVRKGDYVGIGIQASNSNPKYWEAPEKFNPRRFIKDEGSNAVSDQEKLAFLTFSYGRDCVGQQFTFIYVKLVLVTILTRFGFALEPEDYKPNFGFDLLYEPVNPVTLKLTKKQ